nr:ABC transporter permease [Lachnospiraceae bacterium]
MIHKILRKPQAILGLFMMLTVFAVMLFAPALAPNDPEKINILQKFAEPSGEYPLGTDNMGRCIASRLLYGARVSMSVALPTIAAIAVISVLLATVCAYAGGIVDKLFVIISDIFMALPPFLVAMTL